MLDKKSILCIVSLPPPITGAAIASEAIVNYLKQNHHVRCLEYQRGARVLESGKFSFRQCLKILWLGIKLVKEKKQITDCYFVISSTFWGNLRDLFFLFLLGCRLRNSTILHIHGGNLDRYLIGTTSCIKYLNRKFLGDIKCAIVVGEFFINIFEGYVSSEKVRVIKNFFDRYLLISENKLLEKFINPEKVRILFLSNLIKEKGYEILLDAFLSLPEKSKKKATLYFAGRIYSKREEALFLARIKKHPEIIYYGPIMWEVKKDLLHSCHILCLPTYYKHEGQPISILEAYAAGCIVLTTENGGIRDIFRNNINGFYLDFDGINVNTIELRESTKEKLEALILNMDRYRCIAINNHKEALHYSKESYCQNIEQLIISSTSCGVKSIGLKSER